VGGVAGVGGSMCLVGVHEAGAWYGGCGCGGVGVAGV